METNTEFGGVLRAARKPLFFLGVLIVLSLVKGFFTAEIPAGHVGLLFNWGKLDMTAEPRESGLMFKWPWPIQSVEYYPTRLTIAVQKGEAADSKQQLIDTGVAVQLMITPSKAAILRKGVGRFEAVLTTVVDNNILQATKAETTQHEVGKLVGERPKLVEAIQTRLQGLIDHTLAEKGITDALKVVQVGIIQFDFKEGFINAIDKKVRSDQEAYTQAIKKDIKVIESDAAGQRTEILAKATAYRTRVLGDAQAYAIKVVGDASKADARLALYEAIINWNKKAPLYNLDGGVSLMITQPTTATQSR
jgi:regulator of protease activity HflC (stomatin/prohibitin superfamily)